ncbi:MAG TPA: selenium metabolism-associated LysR family transcriptional regulator [Thermoanaerobaculia bacterium]|nr:selenium metabolism-associated LysR family transcriptional regulator [Thermoanaerobaculia bacterium]
MNLRALEAFCATYEEASFTRAARRLGLSQPTISSHIAALEKELGAAMFDRVGREVQPTRAARLLYRHARRLLDLSREMTAELDRFLHGLHGHLLVGASTIPGEYWLPARLGRFHALYPEIEITLEIHDTREVTERVRDGRLELGVVGARIDDGGLEFRELAVDRLVLVAPPTAAWRDRAEVSLDELRDVPFVMREPGSGTRLRFERALAALGLDSGALRVVAELGSTTAVKEAVKAGLGVSVLSRLAIQADLDAGLAVALDVRGLDGLRRSFFSVVHTGRALSSLAEAFLGFLPGD